MNANSTLCKTESYLQEDGIALMNQRIKRITYAYSKTLISEYNTASLRASIHGNSSYLAKTLQENLRVGNGGPFSIHVVCDDTNNPVSLQEQRKLRVDVYAKYSRSIKSVLVYSHVQSLNQ